jgi:hypothetical protein
LTNHDTEARFSTLAGRRSSTVEQLICNQQVGGSIPLAGFKTMAEDGLICWSCGRTTGLVDRIVRSDQCPECGADLKTCRGCRHFDPTRRYQCKEMIDTPVGNKEAANYCDWFVARDAVKGTGGTNAPTSSSKDSRKERFDDLFND